jgi:hypothetical protein
MGTNPETPLSNPVIWRLTMWGRLAHPKLKLVRHAYCEEADSIHLKDKRVYAHSFHPRGDPNTICWARTVSRLAPNSLAGVCLHEFGHLIAGDLQNEEAAEKAADLAIQDLLDPLGLEMRYRGRTLIQWVDFGKMLRRLEDAG